MNYIINISVTNQSLVADRIATVESTVDIIECNFSFDDTWNDFPARQAIFHSSSQFENYVASIFEGSCTVPHEALNKAGSVLVALVGTNTDGQVQRTVPVICAVQTATLKGGVNSIDPTPDQYAQFIADVEEIIGQAGVLSVNGMTGDVTLTASDVGALADTVTIPTRTSQLQNDSGYLSSVPSEYITETELATAIAGKANTADLATVATSGSYNDLVDQPTIPTVPTNVSAFTNDAGYITSAPVSSVNGQTGAVVISNATTSADGLMSSTDKTKLEAVYADYSSAITALGA